MPQLSQLIEVLPSLSKADLRTLKASIEHLLLPDNGPDQELFHITLDILGNRSIGYSAFSKTKAYKVWLQNQVHIDELVSLLVVEGGRKVKTQAVKRFLMGLLIADLKNNNYQITMPVIAAHLVNIKQIVNDAFPGYIVNQLCSLITKAIGGRNGC